MSAELTEIRARFTKRITLESFPHYMFDIDAACARIAALEKPTCTWTQDDFDGSWDGTCGVKWCLEVGGPVTNDMRFCPRCGGPLIEQEPPTEPTDDE